MEPGSGAEQSPARRTSPSAAARSPRACRTRVPGVLDGPRSTTLRQGAPAARCPDARESRQGRPGWDGALALLTSRAARATPALGVLGAGGGGGQASRYRAAAAPALPERKVGFGAAAPEFPAVRSGRPLHCLQCNLLLLILAVGENSSSEQAAEMSPVVLQNKDGGRSLSAGPSRERRPPPARGTFCLPWPFSPLAD